MTGTTSPAAVRFADAEAVHVPIRTCVGCRRKAAKSELRRLVVRDDTVFADAEGPGRGAYVCPGSACLERALKKNGAPLARALRRRPAQIGMDENIAAAASAAPARHDQRREE